MSDITSTQQVASGWTNRRPRAVLSDYGFRWWPEGSTAVIMVDRVATLNGNAILRVSTEHDEIEIAVSKAGRSIRVWRTGSGRELKEASDG